MFYILPFVMERAFACLPFMQLKFTLERTVSPTLTFIISIHASSADKFDKVWDAFPSVLMKALEQECYNRNINVRKVTLVKCSHSGKPAWAQNDAMMEAYIDGMDYGYRINDDTLLRTPGWTEKFIYVLGSMDPPNVGVVGPNHSGGNTRILTYDFTSKTHIDIFGYHYPKLFTDWSAGLL